ncbi:MAG: PepSY domain-containing protein [Neisseria sp.]|nr:PepSY domain-containing protein [Neisseria sp.]
MSQKTTWIAAAIGGFTLVALAIAAVKLLNPAPQSMTLPAPVAGSATTPVAVQKVATPSNGARFSAEQAQEIVRKTAPNAKVNGVAELVNYGGTMAYEVNANTGKFYIDAQNGAVLAKPAAVNNNAPRQQYAQYDGEQEKERGERRKYKKDHDDDDEEDDDD